MTQLKIYQTRNDHEPGWIYLIEAIGFHGIIPGCYLKRCKIGLSRNPQARLDAFHDNQPPCDLRIVRTIYVNDMEVVETQLHKQFRSCNVKLKKSREWFDLNPWQFWLVQRSLDRYEKKLNPSRIPATALIVAGLIGGIAIATLSQVSIQQPVITTEQNNG